MSKAEERALKVYPIKIAKREGYDENLRERKGFVKGYHQAEKDLTLTWENIKTIFLLVQVEWNPKKTDEEIYKEVLKRFSKERALNLLV